MNDDLTAIDEKILGKMSSPKERFTIYDLELLTGYGKATICESLQKLIDLGYVRTWFTNAKMKYSRIDVTAK